MAKILMIKLKGDAKLKYAQSASPPLGLMYLASYARNQRYDKDSFTIIDERIQRKTFEQWEVYIKHLNPDYIALSVLTHEAGRLSAISSCFKRVLRNIPLIAGGPHITSAGAKIFNEIDIDYLIKGEGEISFVKLLNALDQKNYYPKETISGLIFKNEDGSITEYTQNIEVPDVNELPFPAWDLINMNDYSNFNRMTPEGSIAKYAVLFTSRGCPYGCIYCHNIFSKKFRPMNADKVVDEIERLIKEYNVNDFEIFDDIFNLDYDRVMKICAEIKRRGLKTRFSFPNGIRGDLLDRKILKELRSVGAYHMAFAVESANLRVQKLIRKKIDLDKIRDNISIAADEGIFAWGFFMIGFPTETRKEIWNTLKFAFTSKLHGAFFFIVIPHEGTELAKLCSSELDVRSSFNVDYHFSSNTIATISSRELLMIQSLAFLGFFFDPRRIVRIIRAYPQDYKDLFQRFSSLSAYLLYEKPKYFASKFLKNFFNR
jgi:radical SAM superfamily enzyme YgiQ (UPF0313 family)